MAFNVAPVPFTIRVTGEVSGEEFPGSFECLPILTHGQQMMEDRLRRQHLGEDPGNQASPRAQNAAGIFAALQVRITKAPAWFTESRQGLDLFDDNVIATIYGEIQKKTDEYFKALKERSEAAKKELAKVS